MEREDRICQLPAEFLQKHSNLTAEKSLAFLHLWLVLWWGFLTPERKRSPAVLKTCNCPLSPSLGKQKYGQEMSSSTRNMEAVTAPLGTGAEKVPSHREQEPTQQHLPSKTGGRGAHVSSRTRNPTPLKQSHFRTLHTINGLMTDTSHFLLCKLQ